MFSRVVKWVVKPFQKKQRLNSVHEPVILSVNEHNLSKKIIRPEALKVLYRLHEAGFQAYLVGGGVRDGLLQHHPKDFDVVTNARPEQVWGLFRNSRMIGRRFRLVHVHFGGHIVEVATFRASVSDLQNSDSALAHRREDGMIVRDNIYGTLEQDVWRRDFTVNALYYNIADLSLIDYVGGIGDLKNHLIRMIGNPTERYREDPVRMLRAVRFAAKLNFTISKETETPIFTLSELLSNVPSARLYEEYLKLFLSGVAQRSFTLLRQYGLFKILFRQTDDLLNQAENESISVFIHHALQNTDERIFQQKSVTPVFLLAVFLWYPVLLRKTQLQNEGLSELQALHEACDIVFQIQQKGFAIPRRVLHLVKEIWVLQVRFQKRQGHRARDIFMHPRFRAAYDFLLLRQLSETAEKPLAEWWTAYVESDETERQTMAFALPEKKRRHKKKKKHGGFQEKI